MAAKKSNCKLQCSARRGLANLPSQTDHLLTVSTAISTAAKTALDSSSGTSFKFVADDDEACADSGATHVMLHELIDFLSIRKCHHRYVTLGDESVAPVLGQGTTVFSLNGNTILVWNALYVPALRAPLYSLRKHKTMPGCGTFSFHGLGSHILFLHLTLKIDNSVDSLVSYRSIGNSYDPDTMDYAEMLSSITLFTFTGNLN